MRFRTIPLVVVSQLVIGLLLTAPPAAGSAAGQPARKILRSARESLEAGRLKESLAAYEAILEAETSGGRKRSEALYRSALILLVDDESSRDTGLARRRLGEPETVGDDPERGLAAAAILSLLAELDVAHSDLDATRLELGSERQAGLELAALRESELEVRASEHEVLASEESELAARHATVLRDLAGCEVERDLLTDQLTLTQTDQEQMLESVFRKNAELVEQARELSKIQTELETRSVELSRKEAVLEDREEAIRQVTDAILEEDETSDGG